MANVSTYEGFIGKYGPTEEQRLKRANALLSKVPQMQGALGSYDPIKKPTVVNQTAPVASAEVGTPSTPYYEAPKQLNPLRGLYQNAPTMTATPNAPAPPIRIASTPTGSLPSKQAPARGSGIFIGGVEQPSYGYKVDPQVAKNWNQQLAEGAYINKDPNSGVVFGASSNVKGAPSFDPAKQGIQYAGTGDVVNALSAKGYGSKPLKFADYEKQLASMKGDTTRAIAFKPGERAPLSMNQNQKAQYAEKQRQAEQALSRASQERMTETEAKATIGEAEAKGKSALEVAKAQAEGKVESAGSTTAEEMKAIASALGNVSPETSPDVVKALQARLLALAQGGGQEKLTANPELQKQEALNWASKNPKDPRAIEIMKRYGQKTA
jgi:hypothetical protein